MSETRFLVAKYVPDLMRFEPRNIGVIVWSEGRFAAKFLGERAEKLGKIDGRSDGFIDNLATYQQWVYFWRASILGDPFEPATGGDPVAASDPAILDALSKASTGNYILTKGGYLLDQIENLDTLANDLYGQLVKEDDEPEAYAAEPNLKQIANNLVRQHGLRGHGFFKPNYSVECELMGTKETFVFSYAMANGHLQAAWQLVGLSKHDAVRKQIIDATAWKFSRAAAANLLHPDNATSLFYLTADRMEDPKIKEDISILGSVGRLVNLSEEGAGDIEFRKAAQMKLV